MTVKSGASRVGHLYAIWPLPRGEGTPVWKKKWNSCRKPIWTCLTLSVVSLNWSAPTSGFTLLLFHVQVKNSSFQNTKTKRLLSSSLRRHGIIYNLGLNKVANRFGILNYLLAYNNIKIISKNVGQSYFRLNFVHWTLAPGSWLLTPDTMFPYGGNRCLKMRAPVNVKDGVRL